MFTYQVILNLEVTIVVLLLYFLWSILFLIHFVYLKVICGVALMFWVLQKARKELSETLLIADYNNEGKHSDIQV